MLSMIAYTVAATAAQPASVKSGVEHWRAGDYAAAVAAWLPFAAQGDADACFNLGQAYKLGRGVTKDPAVARDYYRRAATKGHLPAQANLGIALFQAGDKLEAVKWLKQAADRGEPRAQYVLGIAAYNGDGTPKNLALAYGYLLRAQASGMAQATAALASIEPVLKPADRTAGTQMADSFAAGTGVPPALAMASARSGPAGIQRPVPATPEPGIVANAVSSVRTALGLTPPVPPRPTVLKPPVQAADAGAAATRPPSRTTGDGLPVSRTTGDGLPVSMPKISPALPTIAPTLVAKAPAPTATPARDLVGPRDPDEDSAAAAATPATSPPPIRTTPVAPAPTAIAAAPASRPPPPKPVVADVAPPQPTPIRTVAAAAAPSKPTTAKTAVAEAKPSAPKPAGWRVQLGAFSSQKLANAAWASVRSAQSGAIGKAKPIFDTSGPVVKFQLGPYASRDAAKDICAKLAFAGRACFVTLG